LPKERCHLHHPGLFIGASRDPVCVVAALERMKSFRKDLIIEEAAAHHWVMREKPDEANRIMEKWLEERF